LDSLVKGSLYFSSPSKLNDPFDCKLDIRKSLLHAADKLSGWKSDRLIELSKEEKLFDSLRTDFGKIGVCSFSRDTINVLMWSHYANNHKGMTILYDFPMQYLDDGKTFIGTVDAIYEENALTNWFIKIAEQTNMTFHDFLDGLSLLVLRSKDPMWSYEKEVRIVRPEPGNFKIDKKYIKQICFGLHTSQDDISLVTEIVKHYDHDVDLCRVIREESDFGINIEDI